jgi:hypothetical protein
MRCRDRMCGADDCIRCHPEGYRRDDCQFCGEDLVEENGGWVCPDGCSDEDDDEGWSRDDELRADSEFMSSVDPYGQIGGR